MDPSHAGLMKFKAGEFRDGYREYRQHQEREERATNSAFPARYTAGPYQKEAALRGAEQAIRPWAPPPTGLGERAGAAMAQWGPASFAPESQGMHQGSPFQQEQRPAGQLGAPLYQPSPQAAAAIGQAAGRVARPGTSQVDAPDAWSAVPHEMGRQIWPADIVYPPRYCVGCRGGHEAARERNPAWEPYTPLQRLSNLNMLQTKFQVALVKGFLCVKQNCDSRTTPILWTRQDDQGDLITPHNMAKDEFVKQLVLAFDGLREGHEPYRHLATQAAKAFLATGSNYLVTAAPLLATPIRLGLQTYEPSLVGHILLMMQGLLRAHPGVGPALQPSFPHFLPYLGLFRPRNISVHLPPPFCLPPTGSFNGSGASPNAGGRKCNVCGIPVDKDLDGERQRLKVAKARAGNAHLMDTDLATAHRPPRHPLNGRKSCKYSLPALISETLDVMVQLGGPGTLVLVQRVIPRYCYFNPKD